VALVSTNGEVPHGPDMGCHVAPIYSTVLEIFGQYLGDIGPFFRPDLGGKLGDGYQLQIYINQGFLKPREDIQSRFMLNIFQAKAIFMQGSY
jgi:hypothetical protein